MDTIDVRTLEINNSPPGDDYMDEVKRRYPERNWRDSPFPRDPNLNERFVVYDGDIELLRAEAIVNPTNEHLTRLDYVTKLAGPELVNFIRGKIRHCPTSEVRLSPGFDSNFSYIIHAVPPKFKAKYKSAAETALFHAYFRVFETMIEQKMRTCVLPVLASSKSNLPLEEHCHIQLRTLRRMLERKRHEFDRVVLHLESQEALAAYSLPVRCYFPRCQRDEELACHVLGSDALGGPNGEPVVPGREIRITSKPSALVWQPDVSIDLRTGLELSMAVGKTAFAKMRNLNERSDAGQQAQAGAMCRRSFKRQYCIIC